MASTNASNWQQREEEAVKKLIESLPRWTGSLDADAPRLAYMAPPVVSSVMPPLGPLRGGSVLVVRGAEPSSRLAGRCEVSSSSAALRAPGSGWGWGWG